MMIKRTRIDMALKLKDGSQIKYTLQKQKGKHISTF